MMGELDCPGCHKRKPTKMCGGCQLQYYCSKRCQQVDWPVHIYQCDRKTSKPIPPAYELYTCALQNVLPTDKQTLMDYGFTLTEDVSERRSILQVYRDLFFDIFGKVKPAEVHKWRKNGTLKEELKKALEDKGFGGTKNYQWFMKNPRFFDLSKLSRKILGNSKKNEMMMSLTGW